MEPQSSSSWQPAGREQLRSSLMIYFTLRTGKHTYCLLGTASIPVNSYPMSRITEGESCMVYAKTKPESPPATCESRWLTPLPRSISWASSPSHADVINSAEREHAGTNHLAFKHFGWLETTIFLYHSNSWFSICQSICLF